MSKSKNSCTSNDRIFVTYRVAGEEKKALACAKDICFEQTVEFPEELIRSEFIRENVVGKIEEFSPHKDGGFKAVISYSKETAADELTQLLNLIFGNISIKDGIRVCDIVLPRSYLSKFKGPRFGKKGLRKLLKVPKRPLLCTALKPMGLSAPELADLAYQCTLGGIDIIKDDHGLTNQCFAPFEERVRLCARAVRKANKKTKKKSVYAANITAPFDEIKRRAMFAKKCGAGAVMIAPGIVGFDTMRSIADDDSIGLPILSHPALQGSYLINPDSGISHYLLFGHLNRLAGADAVIYPNYGGRFLFTREDCQEIIKGTSVKMGHIKPIFPSPGGGMSLKRVPELLKLYGCDVIFLIGGGLFTPLKIDSHKQLISTSGRLSLTGFTHSPDFIENCRYFKSLVNQKK